jgi:hypothetical protein
MIPRFAAIFVYSLLLQAPFSRVAEQPRGRELIQDNHFRGGFILWEPKPGKHVRYGEARGLDGQKPVWGLSQWSSKFPVDPALLRRSADGYFVLSNAAKSIRFAPSAMTGSDLSLGINTAPEYGVKARTRNEPWVHLLVEQEFEAPAFLSNIVAAKLHLEARLLHSRNLHHDDYDPGLHAAQFQVFFTVQNRNRESGGFGDLVWFGIPVYDSRHAHVPEFKSKDFGGTEKFIFTPAGTNFTAATSHAGEWIVIDRDIRPLMLESLQTAWAKGFLSGSKNIGDYAIGGMNMGWELPGSFDVELEVRNLSLEVTDSSRK